MESGGARVLVVDDERFFREAIRDVLAGAGIACVLAADGSEALELAAGPEVGAVVLDVRLPGMDGIEVLRQLRELRPSLRVVMLSAQTDQDLVLEALRLGATDYLAKPLHDEELVLSVRRALEISQLALRTERLRVHLHHLDQRMAQLNGLATRSPGEQESLRNGTVEAVAEVLGADKTSLMLLDPDGGRLRVVAAHGRKLAVEDFDPVELGQGVAGLALSRAEPLLVEDVARDGRFVPRESDDPYQSRSFAVAPILAGERSLGVLCATDPRHRGPFDADDLALLRILAQHAARLLDVAPAAPAPAGPAAEEISVDGLTVPFGDEHGAEREAELARAVCEAMVAEVEPTRLFDAALAPIAEELEATAALYLRDAATGDLVREGQADRDLEPDRERLPAGRGLTGTVLETGRPVATDTPDADPRFDAEIDTPASGVEGPMLCLPLRFRGKTLGVFRAFPARSGHTSPRTGEVLGAALSAAVRNVLLYRSLVESIEEVARARREARGGA